MSRFLRWLVAGAGVLFCLLTVAAFLEPNRVLVGLLSGDDFHNWRPTRYWREVLRREGEAGQLSQETLATFKFRASGAPVLHACTRDRDQKVRWAAVILLGRLARHENYLALPALREALNDEDLEIRLQAIIALGNLGANALNASPDLAAQMKDPELQVQFFAEKALWHVNKKLAIKESGWQTFESQRWSFSASFPGRPAEKQQPGMFAPDKLTIHSFSAVRGVLNCAVAVTEYPPDLFNGTDEGRIDAARDMMLFGLGTRLVDERPVELGDMKGREFTVEKTMEGNGVSESTRLKSRIFWVQRRQYHVSAAYNTELSVVPAADHFLDSFQFRRAGPKMP